MINMAKFNSARSFSSIYWVLKPIFVILKGNIGHLRFYRRRCHFIRTDYRHSMKKKS